MGVIIVAVQAGRVADDVFAPVVERGQHIHLVGRQVEAGVASVLLASLPELSERLLGVLLSRRRRFAVRDTIRARDAVGALTAGATDRTQSEVCRNT